MASQKQTSNLTLLRWWLEPKWPEFKTHCHHLQTALHVIQKNHSSFSFTKFTLLSSCPVVTSYPKLVMTLVHVSCLAIFTNFSAFNTSAQTFKSTQSSHSMLLGSRKSLYKNVPLTLIFLKHSSAVYFRKTSPLHLARLLALGKAEIPSCTN